MKIREDKMMMLFKILYLLHVLFAFNCFTLKMSIWNITTIIIMVVGSIILVKKIIRNKFRFSYKFLWVLILFTGSYFVSSLVNVEYGYIGNIKAIIWMVFQFFLLYWIDYRKEEVEKELKIFLSVLILYTFICSLIGIAMTCVGYGGRTNFADGSGTFYGFIWGRLWGCYTDPNHGALITTIAIFAAVYIIRIVEKNIYRVLMKLTIVVNFLYIVFSDSRSAKLSLTLGCFVWMCIQLKARMQIGKKEVIKSCLLIGVCTVGIYSLFGITKNGYNYIIQQSYIKEMEEKSNIMTEVSDESQSIYDLEEVPEEVDAESNELGEEYIEDDSRHTVGREEDIEVDYSNRRFDIWKSGVEIFNENKIFGVSFRNILPYAEQKMENTYIVSNDYGKFDSFHNVVIDVLVSQGVVGISLFFIFTIMVIVFVYRNVFIMDGNKKIEIQFLVVSVFVIAFDSMFISAVFFVNSPETVIFWTLLGYLIFLLTCDRKEK